MTRAGRARTSGARTRAKLWRSIAAALFVLAGGAAGLAFAQTVPAEASPFGEAVRVRADSLRQEGRLEQARREYEAWASADPLAPEPWFWLGTLERWAGRQHEAIVAYSWLLGLEPCHAAALEGRARVWLARGDVTRAEKDLEDAVRCEPGNLAAQELLADVRARRLDGERTEATLRGTFKGAELERRVGDAWRTRGHQRAALEAYRRALARDPNDLGSAYWVGVLSARAGEVAEAREAYERILSESPQDEGAVLGLERLGARRFVALDGFRDRTEVIEGLDEAGLQVDGVQVVPTRIEYVTDHAGAELGWGLNRRLSFGSSFSWDREAVLNRAFDSTIYDFDVLRGSAGLDVRLARALRFLWRLGAVSYSPREQGSLENDNRFAAEATLEWTDFDSRIAAAYERSSFLRRGFAGDFQFRIFDHDRASLDVRRPLVKGLIGEGRTSFSHYDDGNDVFFGALGFEWYRGAGAVMLRYRHDPFPARFLGADRELEFISYDVLSLAGWRPLPHGFRVSGEILGARFGETARTVSMDTDGDGVPNRVPGPLERNTQKVLRSGLFWTPPQPAFVTLGAEYVTDEYKFDTGPYNTNDSHSWTLSCEVAGEPWAGVRGSLRYARGLVGDSRDPEYARDEIAGRLEARLGRLTGATAARVRCGLELRIWENTLDEKSTWGRVYATLPF
jgi:tetratricopeptide (TPR) repeat protein